MPLGIEYCNYKVRLNFGITSYSNLDFIKKVQLNCVNFKLIRINMLTGLNEIIRILTEITYIHLYICYIYVGKIAYSIFMCKLEYFIKENSKISYSREKDWEIAGYICDEHIFCVEICTLYLYMNICCIHTLKYLHWFEKNFFSDLI